VKNSFRVVSWLLLSATAPFVAACDQFMILSGTVVDCATSTPVGGATLAGHDDAGLSAGQALDSTTTKADGTFELGTDVNVGDNVTLSITKTGYSPLQHRVDGMPDAPLALCLTPASAP
jgi:hypothetical protein